MEEERLQSLLAILAWEERRDRWLSFPPADRDALVELLAAALIGHAEAERRDAE